MGFWVGGGLGWRVGTSSGGRGGVSVVAGVGGSGCFKQLKGNAASAMVGLACCSKGKMQGVLAE